MYNLKTYFQYLINTSYMLHINNILIFYCIYIKVYLGDTYNNIFIGIINWIYYIKYLIIANIALQNIKNA